MQQKWICTKFINQCDLMDKSVRKPDDEVVLDSKHELVDIETSF